MPRAASEGHPRAQPVLVHRSLRQVRAGRGEELFSPASLRGVREINEADLYTIQFIAWKEGGGGGCVGGEMPLVPPRPLRPRKTTIHRPWVQVSQQVGSAPRRSVVPLQRPPLLNVPSKLTRSIAGEGAGGGGEGGRGWQLHSCESSSPPPLAPHTFPPPRLLLSARCFYFQSSAEGPESGEDAAAVPGAAPPRRGQRHRTLRGRGAERGIGAIPAIPRRSCTDPLGQTSSSARSF